MTDTSHGDFRGELARTPLAGLLRQLCANQRTGVLTLTTSAGAAELRLVGGELFDAVYRRLEGEKALFRLLDEREGAFSFVSGGAPALRRIATPMSTLLAEAPVQTAEVLQLKSLLGGGEDAIIATTAPGPSTPSPPAAPVPPSVSHPPAPLPHPPAPPLPPAPLPAAYDAPSHLYPPPSKLERLLLRHLQVPHSLDEVLDDFRPPDLYLLQVIQRLLQAGKLRRVPRATLMTRLAPDDQIGHLRALVTRLVRDGFAGPPRILVAGLPERLTTLAGAILRIDDASAPHDQPPSLPIPHPLATLRFGESVELVVFGLPLVETLLPSWSMFLPGTSVVVTLDAEHSGGLAASCAAAEIPVLHADALLGEVDEADPAQVAALLRTTLETAAGA